MDDETRKEIRKIVEEVLEERESDEAEPVQGLRAPPPAEPLEPEARVNEGGGHGHAERHRAAEAAGEAEGHEHMPHFLFLVRNEKGEVEEIDPSTVPLYEEGLPDEGGEHVHLDKPKPRKKPPQRRASNS